MRVWIYTLEMWVHSQAGNTDNWQERQGVEAWATPRGQQEHYQNTEAQAVSLGLIAAIYKIFWPNTFFVNSSGPHLISHEIFLTLFYR